MEQKRKKRSRSKRKDFPQGTPADGMNESNPKSPASETRKRHEVEKQRKRQHDSTEEASRSNNRFLRALSVPASPEMEVNGAENDSGDDTDTTTRLLTNKGAPLSVPTAKRIIVTPAAGWFKQQETSARRWSQQLKQLEEAGLFVGEERKQLGCLDCSTVDRLEERLKRELSATSQQEQGSNGVQSRHLLLEKLVFLDRSSQIPIEATAASDDIVSDTATEPVEVHDNQQKAPSLAMLELFIDRVVLDDHPTFTLVDRLAAQLRALYTAYSRMQQLQPWQLPLQRIGEFFRRSTSQLAHGSPTSLATSDPLTAQMIQEVNQLLTDLETLSQLHQQIVSKANEMRDAGTRAGSTHSLSIQRRQRTQRVDLSRVEAVLEFLESTADNQQENHTQKTISERFSTISTTSAQALETVLLLESRRNEFASDGSFWIPKFYVVLRVNGKIACTTKAQLWNRGEVRFSEKVCFTLPFFPSSVCAEVYEQRRFLRDKRLSTNAVPVIIPGQNVAKFAPSTGRSPSSGWETNNPNHLVPVASLTPSDEWYQFSSTTPIARKQWHRSFQNAPLFAQTSRHTQGRLHLLARWLSDTRNSFASTGDTAYLPPKRPEAAGGKGISTPIHLVGKPYKRDANQLSQYLCDSNFSSERDFLRLVDPQELQLDPNDPENIAVRRLQVYYTQQQQEAQAVHLGGRRVFRTTDIPDPFDQFGGSRGLTKRNRLLRLRDRENVSRHGTSFCDAISCHDSGKVEPPRWIPQHTVFDEPLPIVEHELLADERLLRLLRPELHAFDRRLLSEEAERADTSIIERHRVQQVLKLQDFRERVRQTQIVRNYNTEGNKEARTGRSKPLEAIVQEKPLPLFPGTLEFPALGELFAPRRRLRPRPNVQTVKASQAAAHWPTACTLYVQVQKVMNVPVRIKPPRDSTEAEELATTGRKRRDTLKKSPRMKVMTEPSSNQSEEVVETPRESRTLEYESHIFVQVNFQGKTRQTSCATITGKLDKRDRSVGAHPMWMETVALPFRPPQDDWSPEGIESTQDIIRFSIFDQVTRPALTTVEDERQDGEERLGAQTRALHRENCFLGSLEVPFLTLYRAGRLEGSLRCKMPVEHLGYANLQVGSTHNAMSSVGITSTGPPSAASSDGEASPRQRRIRTLSRTGTAASLNQAASPRSSYAGGFDDEDDDIDTMEVKQSAREATFLKLTLLLDPVLPVATQISGKDDTPAFSPGSAQDKLLFEHAQRWIATVKNAIPAKTARLRNYNVFVRNLSHGATFLPRFLRAQLPPLELQSASIHSLVRYVSLIPFLDDWLAFDGDKDVWSTSQEFLNMGAGDHEEHAVLLANYFMWYDRRYRDGVKKTPKTYLVIGHAIPEGNIAYVYRQGVLWNASTGVGHAVSDPHCPLRDVSLVVSSKNVFANVQPLTVASVGGTHEFNWEIENNLKCWKPFFTAKNVSLPTSVQRREFEYSETPPEFVEHMERELREALKLAIRRWRSSHFATNFNAAAGLQLRDHLIVLEREANGQSVPNTHTKEEGSEQRSPRSPKILKQRLKMKLALPTGRVHPGSTVLRELQRSREIYGLPLQVSFTDIPRVLEIVENTVCGNDIFLNELDELIFSLLVMFVGQNIHYNERPGVEFALAVYVCGYPNCVLSVWVYLAALVPL
ncbi:Coiled-coil and C2 domain-containing protein 2A [Phytophthora citrophthora]|uniref:Coiled-coil and C2 domain-containing protein 2A n=1 Tax=Phytophthora citrophthora TaxID=4793 RepID=A0AAD9LSF0_9STRA|nr:Coiled-coil and C2 domain-containing protein 2A [Phytophthora citrophthora]